MRLATLIMGILFLSMTACATPPSITKTAIESCRSGSSRRQRQLRFDDFHTGLVQTVHRVEPDCREYRQLRISITRL